MAIKIITKNTFIYSALLFSLIVSFFVVVNIILFANKGFELSDETFYLYSSWYFNSEVYTNTNFGLLNKLSCFNNPSLINLRLAKFIYQSLAVLIFVFSAFRFLKFKKYTISNLQKTFISIIVLMVSYCNYDYLPMTMSYNTWSLVLMLLCFSIIFIEYTTFKKSTNLLTGFIFGFLCFSLFLTKFPNALIALFIYGLFNIFSIKNNIGYKFIGLCIGSLIGYFVFLNNFHDLINVLHNYYAVIFDVKHIKANSYFTQFYDFFIICFEKQFFTIEALVIVFSWLIKKYIKIYYQFFIYLPIVFNYYLSSLFFEGNSALLYNDFIVASLFIINVILFIYLSGDNKGFELPKKEILLMITLLFAMPICLMIGTNNQFYYTTSQTMVFAIMASLILLIYSKQLSLPFLALKTVVICVFVLSILYHGAIKTPYRQSSLLQKKYQLSFTDPINGVYESYERFVDYTALNILTNRFNPSKKDVVLFFNHFGLCFVNGSHVFPESQISDSESLINANEYILHRFKFDDRFDLLILPESVEGKIKFKEMFSKFNVHLNKNYKLVYVYQFLSSQEKIYFYKKGI